MARKKKSRNGSRLSALIIALSAVTACFSLYMIVSTLITEAQKQNAFDELTAIVEQQREQADVPDSKPEQITSPVVTEPTAEAVSEPVILPVDNAVCLFDGTEDGVRMNLSECELVTDPAEMADLIARSRSSAFLTHPGRVICVFFANAKGEDRVVTRFLPE